MIADTKTALRLSRVVRVDPQAAFDAWTQPEQIRRWACPEGHTVAESQVDLRVGGAYLLEIRSDDGATHTAYGVYREVDRPGRLVYTWDWKEDDHQVGETVVTVEFRPHERGTEVVLTHEGFPAEEATEAHVEGWTGCLEKLERHLGGASAPAAAAAGAEA